jgi:hypothetical protein
MTGAGSLGFDPNALAGSIWWGHVKRPRRPPSGSLQDVDRTGGRVLITDTPLESSFRSLEKAFRQAALLLAGKSGLLRAKPLRMNRSSHGGEFSIRLAQILLDVR